VNHCSIHLGGRNLVGRNRGKGGSGGGKGWRGLYLGSTESRVSSPNRFGGGGNDVERNNVDADSRGVRDNDGSGSGRRKL
jgi:hypothetical protein